MRLLLRRTCISDIKKARYSELALFWDIPGSGHIVFFYSRFFYGGGEGVNANVFKN